MVNDPYGRPVNSLRVSVTKDCNLSCFYCHKEGQLVDDSLLSIENYRRLFKVSSMLGIRKIKFTGGEPLMRENLIEIIKVADLYFSDISMTTNGTKLKNLAHLLKEKGLDRINISLHTLNPSTYKKITGTDLHENVIEGIYAAKSAGLNPLKINYVIMKDLNDSEFLDMVRFCSDVGAILQVIELEVPGAKESLQWYQKYHRSLEKYEEYLKNCDYTYNPLHRRKKYRMIFEGTKVEVELVNPMHNTQFCQNCTRLRFTASGELKPCLFRTDNMVSVVKALRENAGDAELLHIFEKAILNREPYWKA